MSTHVPGVQSLLRFLHHFVMAKFATTTHVILVHKLVSRGQQGELEWTLVASCDHTQMFVVNMINC